MFYYANESVVHFYLHTIRCVLLCNLVRNKLRFTFNLHLKEIKLNREVYNNNAKVNFKYR